jgi:hypothetical protein
MLRKTIFVLATAAALTGALTADAVALATAHTGWDGLGGGAHIARKHFGGPGGAFSRGFAVSTFPQRAVTSAALGGISAVVVASHPAWVTRFYDYECSYPYYNPNSCSPSVY